MSGIAGKIEFNGLNDFNKAKIAESITKNRHSDNLRDLKGHKFHFIYSAFYTTELSIYDELPYRDTDENLVLVCDARIDNRNELISDLGLTSRKIYPDSILILESYKKWGKECVDHLIGAFVFLIFNEVDNSFFVARDHFGQKQLYYFHNKNQFMFSNDIETLLNLVSEERKVNEDKVIRNILYGSDKHDETFYRDIKKINAATYLLFNSKNRSLSKKNYYILKPKKQKESIDIIKEDFRDLLLHVLDSMNRTPNNKIGTTLSGGLDSSSIACSIASKNKKRNIYSYTAVFNSLSGEDFLKTDEQKYVDKAREMYDFIYSDINIEEKDFLDFFNDETDKHCRPVSTINGYIHNKIIKKCNEDKVRVLFDGFDGDAVISHGYEHLISLGRKFRFLELFNEYSQHCIKRDSKFRFLDMFKVFILRPNIPVFIETFLLNLFGKKTYKQRRWARLNKKFYSRKREYKKFVDKDIKFKRPNETHAYSLQLSIWEESFEFIDSLGAYNGVEIRLPFFDKRIVEYCISVPSEHKFNNGISRFFFRESMKDILPKEIYSRYDKANLSPIVINSIVSNLDRYIDGLTSDTSFVAKFIDKDYLRINLKNEIKNSKDNSEKIMEIFSIMAIDKWLDNEKYNVLHK